MNSYAPCVLDSYALGVDEAESNEPIIFELTIEYESEWPYIGTLGQPRGGFPSRIFRPPPALPTSRAYLLLFSTIKVR